MGTDVIVLMSAYNGEKFIREQLESIRCQKNITVTLLIRDDGSSDSTEHIISDYVKTFPDFHIEFIRGDNIGYVKSFTELIRIALIRYPKYNYFAFCDHDDIWLDDKLDRAIGLLEQSNHREINNIPIMYCSNAQLVDAELNPIGMFFKIPPSISKPKCLIQNIVIGCTAVFNRKAAILFVERHIPNITVHDQFLYIICTLLGKTIYDHEAHILYRQHGNNQVGKPCVYKRLKQSATKLMQDTHSLEQRAKYILSKFNDLLPMYEKSVVSRLANYRSSTSSRLSFFFDRRFQYDSFISNLIFRMKIIIGRV